jgi:hypothetical protein
LAFSLVYRAINVFLADDCQTDHLNSQEHAQRRGPQALKNAAVIDFVERLIQMAELLQSSSTNTGLDLICDIRFAACAFRMPKSGCTLPGSVNVVHNGILALRVYTGRNLV